MQHINNLITENIATSAGYQKDSWSILETFCKKNIRYSIALIAFLFTAVVYANQLDISGPPGSGNFGYSVTVLPNGNFVVTDPYFDLSNPTVVDVGAVYLYAPDGVQISRLTGSNTNDLVGIGGVTVLSNGNYVVVSYARVGAVTWGNATQGVSGTVSSANSLMGSGGKVTALSNGNYVVRDPSWGTNTVTFAGAVTWGNGVSGTVGEVSAANSLVGSHSGDRIGDDPFGNGDGVGITLLSNGNFVVRSSSWSDNFGAVTWASGSGGTVGIISQANSLVGTTSGDRVGNGGITALSNGNYVVSSIDWDRPAPNGIGDAGAVTWGNGTTGVSGVISATNSLIGSSPGDQIGTDFDFQPDHMISALSNGNYVVISVHWDGVNPALPDVGAVTWGNGASGITGEISASNSYIGSTQSDRVGLTLGAVGRPYWGITELSNGNYVFASIFWQSNVGSVGATTWGNGTNGSSGYISSANSMVGSTSGDYIGSDGITALSNGNYVISSPLWSSVLPAVNSVGAATWGNGMTGSNGVISNANSLVGSRTSDYVGYQVTALTNGNYVVVSSAWGSIDRSAINVGAVTWGNGLGGTVGTVSAFNSLIGSSAEDSLGDYRDVVVLKNGNYVLHSRFWDGASPGLIDVGAVTWGNGLGGTIGKVSAANSLIGSTANDQVGSIYALSNGNYVIASERWDNGAVVDAGAATWGNGSKGTFGVLSAANSLVGSNAEDLVGGVATLGNGNYVVTSQYWDAAETDVGAASWCDGNGGTVGIISSSNSLIGSTAYDAVGQIFPLSDDSYSVVSHRWDNASIINAGAISVGGPLGVRGQINASNSVLGTLTNGGGYWTVVYDATRKHLIVTGASANTVTILGEQAGSLFANGFE